MTVNSRRTGAAPSSTGARASIAARASPSARWSAAARGARLAPLALLVRQPRPAPRGRPPSRPSRSSVCTRHCAHLGRQRVRRDEQRLRAARRRGSAASAGSRRPWPTCSMPRARCTSSAVAGSRSGGSAFGALEPGAAPPRTGLARVVSPIVASATQTIGSVAQPVRLGHRDRLRAPLPYPRERAPARRPAPGGPGSRPRRTADRSAAPARGLAPGAGSASSIRHDQSSTMPRFISAERPGVVAERDLAQGCRRSAGPSSACTFSSTDAEVAAPAARATGARRRARPRSDAAARRAPPAACRSARARYAAARRATRGSADRPRRRSASSGSGARLGRERGEQRADGRVLAVEPEAEAVVDEQPGGARPVLGGLGVPDRLDDVPVRRVPRRPRPGAAPRRRPARSAAAPAAAGPRRGGGSGTTTARRRARRRTRSLPPASCRMRSEPEAPTRTSASAPLTRSRIDVRRSSRRTSSGWRSSTSASRYSATVRSLPANSATNRSGSGWPASESAARRSPAAQPSVRAWSSGNALRPTARRPTRRAARASPRA